MKAIKSGDLCVKIFCGPSDKVERASNEWLEKEADSKINIVEIRQSAFGLSSYDRVILTFLYRRAPKAK